MSETQREYSRRGFLKSGGSVATTPAFIGLEWGPLADNEGPETNDLEYDGDIPQFPDHITEVRDDIDELEDYQPRLEIATQQARDDMEGMFGWIAESDEYEETAYYYWVRSHTQRSIFWYLGFDAGPEDHFKDHEPIIVFVNPDGTVEKTVQSGGHHLAFEIDGEWGHLIEDRVADRRTHVVLRQARPHNHFLEAESTTDGEWIQGHSQFGSWLEKYEDWYRNGRYEKSADRAVMDPFSFHDDNDRTHWWRQGTRDAWLAKHLYRHRVSTPDRFRFEEV